MSALKTPAQCRLESNLLSMVERLKKHADRPEPVRGWPRRQAGFAESVGVTLSGLWNVLDGFYVSENVRFVMTSNRREALDEALLRPGRIDY